jgi:hypothetical protein
MVGVFEVASKLTLRYVKCWILWGYTESGRVQQPRQDPPLPWGIVVRSAYGDHLAFANRSERSRWRDLWLKNKSTCSQNKFNPYISPEHIVLSRIGRTVYTRPGRFSSIGPAPRTARVEYGPRPI